MSFTTTTGFKDIVIYLGYTHNSNNLFIEASRIGWPNGVGDNTTFGIVLGGAIAFTSFFAAGDTVRPLYGGFCGGGYVTGFAPIDFGLARLG